MAKTSNKPSKLDPARLVVWVDKLANFWNTGAVREEGDHCGDICDV